MAVTTVHRRNRGRARSRRGNGRAQDNKKTRLANLVLKLTFLVTLLGASLVVYMSFTRATVAELGETVSAGKVTLTIENTEWLIMDHGGHDDGNEDPNASDIEAAKAQGQVFPMPSSMMPDTPPEGQQRLRVEFFFQNVGEQPQTYSPEEFELHSADGETWPAMAGTTFRPGTLTAGQAFNSVVFFDVDYTATDLYLVWNKDGKRVQVPMENPTHEH
ncbi:MAG: DUF4352 domain-containing protein [Anaerolineae bacterium]